MQCHALPRHVMNFRDAAMQMANFRPFFDGVAFRFFGIWKFILIRVVLTLMNF